MNQILTTYSTGLTTRSKNSTEYIWWIPSMWSEPRRTWSIRQSNGKDACQRMCLLMPKWDLQVICRRRRWLIELFFKWLKQHLKIKKFWGTTENAVRIQIAVAIITYCLVAIVHHDMKLERSTYEVLHILSISLTDKTHLTDLFDKTKFKDVKEPDFPLFKGLFD